MFRQCQSEIRNLQEKLKLEKESWEENYMKRHETWLVQKERELREKVRPILLSFFFYVSRKLNLNYTSEFCWHNFKIVVFSVNFEAETNDKSESKNKLTCNHFLNIFINLCEDIYFSFCLYVRNLIQANVLFYFI